MKVLYARRSRNDFERIRKRITKESGSFEVADRFIARLVNACDALTPLSGRYPSYDFTRGWRMMPFKSYLVYYKMQGEDVVVVHVRHAARKPSRK